MAKTKRKNPSFVMKDATYSLFMNFQSFGEKGTNHKLREAQLAKLNTEKAKEYGELAAIHMDLRFCEHLCDRMLANRRQLKTIPLLQPCHTPIMDEMRMAMIASHVAYCRCFGSGTRQRLDHRDIWREGDPARDAHQYFKDVRDKFVAHSVNDFEDVGVALAYIMEEEGPSVFHVMDAVGTSILPSDYLVKWLRRLSKQAQKHVENRIDQLFTQILKSGKQLTESELKAMPTLSLTAGAYDKPGKARSR